MNSLICVAYVTRLLEKSAHNEVAQGPHFVGSTPCIEYYFQLPSISKGRDLSLQSNDVVILFCWKTE
jgi:hypothetical protein